jgi:hypothetical protein
VGYSFRRDVSEEGLIRIRCESSLDLRSFDSQFSFLGLGVAANRVRCELKLVVRRSQYFTILALTVLRCAAVIFGRER